MPQILRQLEHFGPEPGGKQRPRSHQNQISYQAVSMQSMVLLTKGMLTPSYPTIDSESKACGYMHPIARKAYWNEPRIPHDETLLLVSPSRHYLKANR